LVFFLSFRGQYNFLVALELGAKINSDEKHEASRHYCSQASPSTMLRFSIKQF
jgi:hypothetical protein